MASWDRSRRAVRRRPVLRAVPAVEELESRWLLSYTVTDLGTLGGRFSGAYAVNNAGWVAGTADRADTDTHAFLYDGRAMLDLGPAEPGGYGIAWAVNGQGWVAGGADFPGTGFDAFLDDGTQMLDLGTLGGAQSVAYGLNDAGWAVGLVAFPDRTHPFLYDGQTMTDLGNLAGGIGYSAAFAVNDRGQVVGGSTAATSDAHAFLWQGGVMTDLGALSGPAGRSAAYAINAGGLVAGTSDGHAVVWQGGDLLDLGVLAGYGATQARGINNRNQVVGYAQRQQGTQVVYAAFLYDHGRLTDLNTLLPPGLHLDQAFAINDRGQIAGVGHQSGSTADHAWLLSPPPGRPPELAPDNAALAVPGGAPSAGVLAVPVLLTAPPAPPAAGADPARWLTAGVTASAAAPPAAVPPGPAAAPAVAADAADLGALGGEVV